MNTEKYPFACDIFSKSKHTLEEDDFHILYNMKRPVRVLYHIQTAVTN
jgi:hypothetical protein